VGNAFLEKRSQSLTLINDYKVRYGFD